MTDPLQQPEEGHEVKEQKSPDTGVRSSAMDVPSILVQTVLGISLPDGTQRTQLDTLTNWVNENKTGDSQEEIRAAIYSLEKHTGEPKLGETRLGRLYNYIKLSQKISDLEAARKEYAR